MIVKQNDGGYAVALGEHTLEQNLGVDDSSCCAARTEAECIQFLVGTGKHHNPKLLMVDTLQSAAHNLKR